MIALQFVKTFQATMIPSACYGSCLPQNTAAVPWRQQSLKRYPPLDQTKESPVTISRLPKSGPTTTEKELPSTAAPVATTPSDAHVEQSVKDFQMFISFIFSVAIFGASTFAVIAGQMADPADLWRPDGPPFRLPTVRVFLSVAWLCFVLAIALAGYSSSLLTVLRQRASGVYSRAWGRGWDNIGILVSVVLHLLLVTAFLFLSLALVAYVGTVGWVAVGFSAVAIMFVLALSC